MKNSSHGVIAVVFIGFLCSSAASAAVSSPAAKSAEVEKVVRDMQAHQIKYDQDTRLHAAPEVIAADSSALADDQKNLKEMTGK